jgi:hypothetical protein
MRQLSKNEQTESNFDKRISSTPRSAQRVSSMVHALKPRAWKASTAAPISLSPGQPAELASIYVELAANDASGDYFPEVKSMPVAAKAIRAVPNQPNILRYHAVTDLVQLSFLKRHELRFDDKYLWDWQEWH